ncbi:L-serine ammonia-lyase, iron-sulfur-dependent, subunit alpha [Tyzzerella sp. OttesenSCG-928-J15]|nr:L-serine ammonia-lyase, iron-sulfur-dependent, subunit alpha [Tyzzerella sp. OttesenSCG-928-J15]
MNYCDIVKLIKLELKPSMGCTEPVAVGLAVAKTCCYLNNNAEKISIRLSKNIFKNAYCVKIPNTVQAGIPLAAVLGYLLSEDGCSMELFSGVNDALVEQATALLAKGFVKIDTTKDKRFYIEVTAENKDEKVTTITVDRHDNLVFIERGNEILLDRRVPDSEVVTEQCNLDILNYSIKEIVEICENIPIDDIRFLSEAIEMNQKAADEGLANDYGLCVGKSIKGVQEKFCKNDLFLTVKSVVAAACDCRMGGGSITAMTVTGSGNQGFEAILPVATVGKCLEYDEEKTIRGVMLSILTTIYIKYHVGRLSPVCGATLSGAAASSAIAWMMGGNISQVEGAIQNMMGNLSGMLCDGAKDGCALKLANCAGEALLSALISLNGSVISKTDGLICEHVEDTIKNIARLTNEGLSSVDQNIISIMLDKNISK